MSKPNAIQDAFSILILLIGLFTCFNGFLCDFVDDFFNYFTDALFGGFVLSSYLITLVLHLCRLFRISFSPRKGERIIAIIYILLFIISSYSFGIFIAFGLGNFRIDTPRWLIVRNFISIPFLVFCALWLAIRCVLFLINGRSPIIKEEPPTPTSDTTSTH